MYSNKNGSSRKIIRIKHIDSFILTGEREFRSPVIAFLSEMNSILIRGQHNKYSVIKQQKGECKAV